jgi:hypothetical protein
LSFDGGDGWQLWQWWTIETAFNGGGGGGVQWRQQRLTAFDGVGNGLLRREVKRAVKGEATQQPASMMREQENKRAVQRENNER